MIDLEQPPPGENRVAWSQWFFKVWSILQNVSSLTIQSLAGTGTTDGSQYVGVTDTTPAPTITIAEDDEVDGALLTIADESGGATSNAITIVTESASTIDGAASVSIISDYGVVRLIYRADLTMWKSI